MDAVFMRGARPKREIGLLVDTICSPTYGLTFDTIVVVRPSDMSPSESVAFERWLEMLATRLGILGVIHVVEQVGGVDA